MLVAGITQLSLWNLDFASTQLCTLLCQNNLFFREREPEREEDALLLPNVSFFSRMGCHRPAICSPAVYISALGSRNVRHIVHVQRDETICLTCELDKAKLSGRRLFPLEV